MRFWAQFVFVALLAAGGVAFAQRPGPASKRPGAVTARPPHTMLDRWNRMPADERKRLLDQLPPDRRSRLENRMHHFNELSDEQREELSERFQAFRRMPPETQERARQLFRQFNQLSDDRRTVVRNEFENLRGLAEGDRRARMNSDEFRKKFSSSEQEFLHDLASVMASDSEKASEKKAP
jgi:hypothetical protein